MVTPVYTARQTNKIIKFTGSGIPVPLLHLTGKRVNAIAPAAAPGSAGALLPTVTNDAGEQAAIMIEIRAIEGPIYIKFGDSNGVVADMTIASQLMAVGERQMAVPFNPATPGLPFTYFSVLSQSSATAVTVQIESLE